MARPRVLSGVQPTGSLHLGNWLGAIRNWVDLQRSHDTFFCVVDLHAITVPHDPKQLAADTRSTAALYLAFGIDPDQATVFVQSQVPAHAELAWLLNCVTPLNWLERMIQFKEKAVKQGYNVSVGLLDYPVLMAADILLYDTDQVPVGEDQKQHLEITRDIATRFNNIYGKGLLVVPSPDINEDTMLVPGIDGQKMSKSYANTIPIFADEKLIKKSVMSITTDSAGINEPKDKDSPLFKIYSLFLNSEEKYILNDRYDTPGLKYGDVKKELLSKIIEYFSPYREKREYLSKNIDQVHSILDIGRDKASKVADEYIKKIRDAMGLNY